MLGCMILLFVCAQVYVVVGLVFMGISSTIELSVLSFISPHETSLFINLCFRFTPAFLSLPTFRAIIFLWYLTLHLAYLIFVSSLCAFIKRLKLFYYTLIHRRVKVPL